MTPTKKLFIEVTSALFENRTTPSRKAEKAIAKLLERRVQGDQEAGELCVALDVMLNQHFVDGDHTLH